MPPLIGRFVPFLAVAAANSINLPLMRQRELKTGVPIYDEDKNYLGMSTVYYVISVQLFNISLLLDRMLPGKESPL